jgi:hypothetical protein
MVGREISAHESYLEGIAEGRRQVRQSNMTSTVTRFPKKVTRTTRRVAKRAKVTQAYAQLPVVLCSQKRGKKGHAMRLVLIFRHEKNSKKRGILGLDISIPDAYFSPTRARGLSPKGGLGSLTLAVSGAFVVTTLPGTEANKRVRRG